MLLKFIQDAYTSPVHLTKVSNTSTCPLSRVPSPFFVLEVQFFWQSIFMCGFINWRTDYVERSVVCIAFQSLNCSVKPPSRGSPNSPQRMCPLPSRRCTVLQSVLLLACRQNVMKSTCTTQETGHTTSQLQWTYRLAQKDFHFSTAATGDSS